VELAGYLVSTKTGLCEDGNYNITQIVKNHKNI
jgi:hypothetical protein